MMVYILAIALPLFVAADKQTAPQNPTEVLRAGLVAVIDSLPPGDRVLARTPLRSPAGVGAVDVEWLLQGLEMRAVGDAADVLACTGRRWLGGTCTLQGADVLLTLQLGSITANEAVVLVTYDFATSPTRVERGTWEVGLVRSRNMWVPGSLRRILI